MRIRQLFFVLGFVLVSGCVMAPPPGSYRLSTPSDFEAFMRHIKGDVMAPAAFVAGGASLFWIANKSWPTSLEEIRKGSHESEEWSAALEKISDVTFLPTSDRALTIVGLLFSPEPFRFTATIVMREAPGSEVGWKPEVDLQLKGKEPNRVAGGN
jgi:hypothetical protein